jgi:ATP-citrate lyase alpha-subunit
MTGLFNKKSQAIFWNNNAGAIQRMLDYDFVIKREIHSVAAIVAPTASRKFELFFYGANQIKIPVYVNTEEAVKNHPQAKVFLNFASFRGAFDITMQALKLHHFKTIMITAEGVPERMARLINLEAKKQKVTLIGPASVGGITAGAFRIANIGGTLSNMMQSKLHRPGSCGLVTRSGGLFNELANIIAQNSDGIAEGIAIGGDRFVGTTFVDYLILMEKDPKIKYMLMLGEVGGTDEYEVIKAKQEGLLTKPIIAWCIGTIAENFSGSVQFGHAGASANSNLETARSKNLALKESGFYVPETFNAIPETIHQVYQQLLKEGVIEPIIEPEIRELPVSQRKSKNFICTISDDRGDEATYAGIPISSVATPDTGYHIGDVISLLWFKKRYPKWATDFFETVLKTVADHGPAVSGAHNAKVTARAGKSVVESLVTGLLTIGPRFGGAIDDAAKYFKYAYDENLSPPDFLVYMKNQNIPIPGIGHRIKSLKNPDKRVEGLKNYATRFFPQHALLDYALKVELETTAKKDNLILNVDGTIGILMVDMWRSLGYAESEIDEFISGGTLNAFFILGRSIGFIGHILDEKRLQMPMYRHPFDDILYDVTENE